MHGHGAAVVVDVVAALAVGEDLDALGEAGGVGRGRGQRVGAVRVPDAEGDLDGLGVDEGRAAGQWGRRSSASCHVAGVGFQLVVQALHQLILGSGGDYLHACLYTRILTRTASSRAYIDVRPVRIAFCGAKPCKTSYYSRVYTHIRPGVIAFCGAKPCRKNSPQGGFFIFLSSLNVSRQLVKAGRRQAPA